MKIDWFVHNILNGKVEKALFVVPPGKLKMFLQHQDVDLETLKKLEVAARDVSLRSPIHFVSVVWTDMYMKCLRDSQFVKRFRKAKLMTNFYEITQKVKQMAVPNYKPDKKLKEAIVARDMYYLSNMSL